MAEWEGSEAKPEAEREKAVQLQDLPDDVLALISGALQPRDLCNLMATCRLLRACDTLWMPQCERVVAGPEDVDVVDVQAWRRAMASYKAVYRCLRSVKPLLGMWRLPHPYEGCLMYCTWGFVSLLAFRLVPHDPLPLEGGKLFFLGGPMFEIMANPDGSPAFILHGQDTDMNKDLYYPRRDWDPFEDSRDFHVVDYMDADAPPAASAVAVHAFYTPYENHEEIVDDLSPHVCLNLPGPGVDSATGGTGILLPICKPHVDSSDRSSLSDMHAQLLADRRLRLMQMYGLQGQGQGGSSPGAVPAAAPEAAAPEAPAAAPNPAERGSTMKHRISQFARNLMMQMHHYGTAAAAAPNPYFLPRD